MKKFILILLLILPLLSFAQQPPLSRQFSFLATGVSSTIDVRGLGLNYYRLAWDFNGVTLPSACSVQVQGSSNTTTWTTIATGTCTSASQTTITQASANYIRVNLATFTAATSGDLIVNLSGWVSNPVSSGGTGTDINIASVGGTTISGANVVDVPNTAFRVNCITGCTPGGSFADSTAFTFGTTAVGNTAFVVDDTATNSVAENSAGAARMSTKRILYSALTDVNGTAVGGSGNPIYTSPANIIATGMDLSSVGGTGLSGANVVDAPNNAFKESCVTGCLAGDTTGTPTALNANGVSSTVVMANQKGVTAQFATGTLVGTVQAQVSRDNGAHWEITNFSNLNGATNNSFRSLTNPSNVQYNILFTGAITNARVTVTAFTSGTVDVTLRAVASNTSVFLYGYSNSLGIPISLRGADDGSFVAGGLATTAAPSYTDAHDYGISLSLAGGLRSDITQINDNTILAGNGVTGNGSPRVTISSDNSNSAGIGASATGSAVPSAARYIAAKGSSGNLVGLITCDNYVFDRSSTADVQLVAISGSTAIYVCGYTITGESTTASDVNLRYATNSNCTTGGTSLTPPITVGAGTAGAMLGGISVPTSGFWSGLKTPASDNLCVHRSAAQTSEIQVWYTQF